MRFIFKDSEIPEGKLASKVLKVYLPGKASEEAANQATVFDLVAAQSEEDQVNMAKIPKPLEGQGPHQYMYENLNKPFSHGQHFSCRQ